MEETYKEQNFKKNKAIIELREEIAKQLYKNGTLTEEEIKKFIPNATYEEVSNSLRNMLQLKLIKKEGFPVKYLLSEEIKEKLSQRKNTRESDKNPIKVNVIIESKSNDKEKLRLGMESILKSLKEAKIYVIYDVKLADIVVHDDLFSTYIEAELSCLNLSQLLHLIYYFGVTSIDVIKPEKLSLPISDFQESLFTIIDMTHGYADMIFKLKSENEQLRKLLNR